MGEGDVEGGAKWGANGDAKWNAKGAAMNVSGARRRANLSIADEPAESAAAAQVVARARIIMLIAALTTALAIAAVVTVIGYRMFSGAVVGADDLVSLPKGARVISTSASAGRLAVLIEIDGVNELRTFDIKTLKQTGRLRFTREP